MNNHKSIMKIAGSILLGFAGLITSISVVGMQISNAIVLSGFFAGNRTGLVPPGPTDVNSLWIVLAVLILVVAGLYMLFAPQKSS